MDVEEAEVLFAQKLADCEPSIRRKAFSRLQRWITSRMNSDNQFRRDDLIVLWKGLYYCMWMQDKPLLQEELADRLCSLGDVFTDVDQHILYLDTFLETISREWYQIDRWRVDKFMMLFRRFFRHAVTWLKLENWDEQIWLRLSELYSKTVWATASDAYPEELKCHFASIYLDEMDVAGAFLMTPGKTFDFLSVYINLLPAKISSLFFHSIETEIFEAILIDFVENTSNRKKEKLRKCIPISNPAGASNSLQIDYTVFADALMETGKSKSVTNIRRCDIYKLAKQFRTAATGRDPFMTPIEIQQDIRDEELDKAARELLKLDKPGKKRKARSCHEIADGIADHDERYLPKKKHKSKKKETTKDFSAKSRKRIHSKRLATQ